MTLNKQNGNMYPWVTHTWNPLIGECPHRCKYCYVPDMKRGAYLEILYSGVPRVSASALGDKASSYSKNLR